MCGIAGAVRFTGAEVIGRTELVRMAGALHHRGPDEFGIYRDPRAGLAHARLSIIDLSTGQQPLSNEDGSLWVVFNGEIFNYVELREELIARGHRFRTQSDTEVIVHAYEEWREQAFERMNGQWALALWDARARELVLSRDRLGVRPLYICSHQGTLFFASEVRAIFAADPSIPRELDPVGLDQTFTFWTVVPPQTVFRGVEELEPGHFRRYKAGSCDDRAFWAPRYPEDGETRHVYPGSLDDAVNELRQALDDATALRMLRADVPVGSYLSGGIDSSLVATLGARHAKGRLQTFSLRFADPEYDETTFQRLVAEQLGSEHHEVVVDAAMIAAAFPDVIRHTERPILRTAPAPLFLLSKLVRDAGIKVVLTGEGADEMLGGYDLFREGKIRRFWAKAPKSECRPHLIERLYPYLARSPVSQRAIARQFFGRGLASASAPGFAHDIRWHTTSALKRLFAPALRSSLASVNAVPALLATLPSAFSTWHPLAQDQYLEVRTLLGGYLLSSQGDRMLMAHSIEGRFPFLDKNVVALADSLPARYKLRVLDEKHVLKRASRGVIADAIVARQKQPYRAPDAASFVGQGRPEYVDALLSPSALAAAGVFEPRGVAQLLAKLDRPGADGKFSNTDNMAFVGVLSTQLLYEQHVRHLEAPRSVSLSTDVDHTALWRD